MNRIFTVRWANSIIKKATDDPLVLKNKEEGDQKAPAGPDVPEADPANNGKTETSKDGNTVQDYQLLRALDLLNGLHLYKGGLEGNPGAHSPESSEASGHDAPPSSSKEPAPDQDKAPESTAP